MTAESLQSRSSASRMSIFRPGTLCLDPNDGMASIVTLLWTAQVSLGHLSHQFHSWNPKLSFLHLEILMSAIMYIDMS
ncbi:hypothetical protein MPTK1_5g02470 [Marchantia polymorpha subsp. ruderalis]|uniref:Uncharacterized protein n=2 Tax=Marchantia polymorpha TaxID=3197 RepID=A0AAF6BE70_MARPO|nr:hypothetical protein MARPO_0147s0040 [Marchantia polymorpha]BBN10304.1 hypothetical protein Mp_5g02470 [Marchantia polymorpha subsp. ruderalis]|eukprot:PTQ29165.1 hypothetical protein MARPO_0147s0040 [Marchantia polymorpha]